MGFARFVGILLQLLPVPHRGDSITLRAGNQNNLPYVGVMKGFLNKVQGKGGKGEGGPASEGMPVAGHNTPKLDSTPQADVALPRKHDRRLVLNNSIIVGAILKI